MHTDHDEAHLLSLAQAVSRRDAVDWDVIDRLGSDPEEHDVLRALRALDAIARVHGSVPPLASPDLRRELEEPDLERWRHLSILERVGQGAFGTVFRAKEEGLDREVALKLQRLREVGTSIEPAVILVEARLLAQVDHPNVVTVYGADAVDGRVGLWMEFIRGRTLEDLLRLQGPFAAREAAAIGIDLCHALAAVHGAGLLHRDVKCQNVMRAAGGRIVLMDFGAGACLSPHGADSQPVLAGTPAYLPPELFEGGASSKAGDVYSLGVLIYHLVSNAYPVVGATTKELAEAHRRRERRRLLDIRPDLPESFVRVLERALAHEPEHRLQTAGELADGLAASLGFVRETPRVRDKLASPRPSPPRAADRRRRWMMAAALVVLTAAAGGSVWWGIAPGSRAGDRGNALDPGASLPVGTSDAASYQVSARFHVVKGPTEVELRPGGRIAPGDKLFLTVRATLPLYVYVVNQDEQGESYLSFPLDDHGMTNPLAAGVVNQLPGRRGGQDVFWQVDSAGGREHFYVFASPTPLAEFERSLAMLPRPKVDRTISVPLPDETIDVLRGVGGLAATEATPPPGPRPFPFATPLLDRPEITRGFWAREIVFDNPTR